MTLRQIFATPMIVERPEVDIAALKKAILAEQQRSPGIMVSNLGGWHSDFRLFEWGGDAARALGGEVVKLANANTEMGGIAHEWAVEGWANVLATGGSNAAHAHPGNFWSAVFYVDVEGTGGELILHDPRMPALKMHAPALSFDKKGPESAAKITVSTGKLVMFPSWLLHSVLPWQGEQPRISIAINLAARRR